MDFYQLYIGDADEPQLLGWLCENLSPVVFTTRAEGHYTDMYHGGRDLWILDSQDVSDTSSQFDTITVIYFQRKEDRLLCQLTFGGSCC